MMTEASAKIDAAVKQFNDEYENGSIRKKATMKAAIGLSLIIDSALDRSVKFDAMIAAVDMLSALVKLDTLDLVVDCEKKTQAPIGLIVGVQGLKASAEANDCERRFNTMMELFK